MSRTFIIIFIKVGAITTFAAVPIFKAVVNGGNKYDLGHYFFLILSVITMIHPIYILRAAKKNSKEPEEIDNKLLKS